MSSRVAGQIMRDINWQHSKMGHFRPKNQKPENRKYRCLICGETLPSLMHAHTKKHGYSKAEMIAAGLVEWL